MSPTCSNQPNPCALHLIRPTDEDDGDRPHKRIKLESAEISTEADVVNLQKPPLGLEGQKCQPLPTPTMSQGFYYVLINSCKGADGCPR